MEPKYYTVAETADIFGVSDFTIRRWLRAGDFAGAFNAGGAAGWRIPLEAINELAAKRVARAIVQEAAASAAVAL